MNKKAGLGISIAGLIALIVVGMIVWNHSDFRLKKYMDLGERYLTENDYDQAVIAFLKAIEIDPMSVEAYLGAANAYVGQGDYESALEILNTGIEKTGDDRLKARYEELEQEYYEFTHKMQDGFVALDDSEWIDELIQWYRTLNPDVCDESYYSRVIEGKAYEVSRNSADKKMYYGESEDGIPNGFGLVVYGVNTKARTLLYIGDFVNGKRSGNGVAVFLEEGDWENSGYYIGEWSDDVQNGQAILYRLYKANSSIDRAIKSTAIDGMPEGVLRCEYIHPTGNIYGYQYLIKDGEYVAYDDVCYVGDNISEPVYNYLISENGELSVAWHPWGGFKCELCHDDSEGLDAVMNSRDHALTGKFERLEIVDYRAVD